MLKRDRGLDNEFEPEELLFIRLRSDQVDDKQVIVATFPSFPNPSSNRSRYSEPEDVLMPIYLDWGIIQFHVGDIPRSVQKGDGVRVEIRPVHAPEVINYAHTEIAAFDPSTGERIHQFENKVAVKYLRGELAKKAMLIKTPAISNPEWNEVKSARFAFKAELENRYPSV